MKMMHTMGVQELEVINGGASTTLVSNMFKCCCMKRGKRYVIITISVVIGLLLLNSCWPDIKHAVFDAWNGC